MVFIQLRMPFSRITNRLADYKSARTEDNALHTCKGTNKINTSP